MLDYSRKLQDSGDLFLHFQKKVLVEPNLEVQKVAVGKSGVPTSWCSRHATDNYK